MISKICSKCDELKSIKDFHKDPRVSSGVTARCKACRTALNAAYQKSENGKARIKAYRKTEKFLAYQRAWQNRRCKTDLNFKLKRGLRNRLRLAIKNNQKLGSAVADLGCGISFLKNYLECLFTPGMTWDNWGNGDGCWNIDHVQPLSAFDLAQRDQFLAACHFTNLRPMWAIENIKKSDHTIWVGEDDVLD